MTTARTAMVRGARIVGLNPVVQSRGHHQPLVAILTADHRPVVGTAPGKMVVPLRDPAARLRDLVVPLRDLVVPPRDLVVPPRDPAVPPRDPAVQILVPAGIRPAAAAIQIGRRRQVGRPATTDLRPQTMPAGSDRAGIRADRLLATADLPPAIDARLRLVTGSPLIELALAGSGRRRPVNVRPRRKGRRNPVTAAPTAIPASPAHEAVSDKTAINSQPGVTQRRPNEGVVTTSVVTTTATAGLRSGLFPAGLIRIGVHARPVRDLTRGLTPGHTQIAVAVSARIGPARIRPARIGPAQIPAVPRPAVVQVIGRFVMVVGAGAVPTESPAPNGRAILPAVMVPVAEMVSALARVGLVRRASVPIARRVTVRRQVAGRRPERNRAGVSPALETRAVTAAVIPTVIPTVIQLDGIRLGPVERPVTGHRVRVSRRRGPRSHEQPCRRCRLE
ncbi:MAG: hypothetical protein JWM76_424 [Pseudonocardiales bacterium]|nr:hypothetical protein [Pseudonocardiales bacterium]